MNMQSLMAQAQKIQRDITKKKEEIEKKEFEGKSEWVEVVFTGDRKLKSFKVLKSNIVDQDDVEMLQDMAKIAIDNALDKIDKEYAEKMGMYSSMNGLM